MPLAVGDKLRRDTRGLSPRKFAPAMALGSIAIIWMSGPASAQTAGLVADPGGAVVAGAQIRITETDTGVVRTVPTSGNGILSRRIFKPEPTRPHWSRRASSRSHEPEYRFRSDRTYGSISNWKLAP